VIELNLIFDIEVGLPILENLVLSYRPAHYLLHLSSSMIEYLYRIVDSFLWHIIDFSFISSVDKPGMSGWWIVTMKYQPVPTAG
jgi:hypothetical protein